MRRMIFSKRTLALLLALMMTLSVVYVPAFATGSEADTNAPAGHTCEYGEPIVVAPDHVNGKAGYTYFECQVEGCDKVFIDKDSLVDPDEGDHVWEDHAAKAPTCTEEGNLAYKTCKKPGCEVLADENGNVVEGGKEVFVVPALGHKFTEWTVTTDYLCTDLHTSRECLVCGFVEKVDWNEDGHNYQPIWDTYVAPTCSKDGKVQFECVAEHVSGIECSAKTEVFTVKKTRQHETYLVEGFDATCTTEGRKDYHVCTMCGGRFLVPNAQGNQGFVSSDADLKIPALGHDMPDDYTRVDGSECGVDGNLVKVCKRDGCDHTETGKYEHDWSEYVRIPNLACGTENNLVRECSICHEKEYNTQEHKYAETVTESVKYCEKTIVTVGVCEYCGDSVTTTTTEVCHVNVVTLDAVKATCVSDGLTEGKQCADCGVVLTAQETVSAAELFAKHQAEGKHNVGAVQYKFPTCTTVGNTTGYKCSECDVVVVAPEEIPATGHTYNEEEIPATCQTVGYRAGGFCSVCEYVVPGKTIAIVPCAAKAENILVSEANCQSPAIYKSECKWCDTVLDSNIKVGEKNPDKHVVELAITPASVAADCVTDGYAYYGCSACEYTVKIIPNGATKADEEGVNVVMTEDEFNAEYPGVLTFKVTKTGHNMQCIEATKKAPTCTEKGYEYYICLNEGCQEFEVKTPNELGHIEETLDAVAPGCESTGLTEGVKCTRCNEILVPQTTVGETGHTGGTATCNAEAVCTTCGVSYGGLDPDNHAGTATTWIKTADTHKEVYDCCPAVKTAEAAHTYVNGVCSVCEYACAHTGGVPTCTAPGVCTACGVEYIPSTGHGEYTLVNTTVTCTEAGTETYKCSNGCGDTRVVENVAPYGHKNGNVVVENEVAATCTTSGSYDNVVRCTECNVILSSVTVPVNALGHTPAEAVKENVVTATCVDKGSYDNVVYCATCKTHEISREKIVEDPKGHSNNGAGEYTIINDSTCYAEGSAKYVCADCHTQIGEIVPVAKKEHTPGEQTTVTGATCLTDGEAVIKCTVAECGAILETKTLPATGHSNNGAGEYTIINDSTCYAEGSAKYVCADCSTQIGEIVPIAKKEHTPGALTTVTGATCLTDGEAVIKCTVAECGATLETKTLPATGHTYDGTYKSAVVLGTCENGEGKFIKNCSVCDLETEEADSVVVPFDTTVCDHGTQTLVDGVIVYVTAYGENKNVNIDGVWKYVPHVSDECQDGVVGGYVCYTCDEEMVINSAYEDKKVGDVLPAVHDYSTVNEYEATCMSEGYVELVCDCGHSYTIDNSYVVADKNDKNVHKNLGDYVIKVQASCDNVNGIFVQTCPDCGMTFETEVTYDLTKGHGYITAFVDGQPVYDIHAVTVVGHVSNKCQEGTVGGEYCTICDYTKHEVEAYKDMAIGAKIKPVHNMTADAKAPSCEGVGVPGYTYHEYCLDCDLGHDPVAGGWEVIPCTKCVEITVSANAPTCTVNGNSEYTYRACCETKAQIAAKAEAAVIPATNHAGTVETKFTAAPTCTTPQFEYKICTACNGEETFEYVRYIAPLGHNVADVAGTAVDATCSVDGKTADKICDRCHAEDTFVAGEVIPATGHVNANGEKFLDTDKCSSDFSDEVLKNGRFCETCKEYIPFAHRYVTQTTEATCKTGEVSIEVCVDCNVQGKMENVRGPWTEEEHKAHIMSHLVDHKDATYTEYGTDTYKCPHCDETIVVYLPLDGGIEFELDYNVVYPEYDENGKITGFTKSDRKETANGTWIAVDVLVYSNSAFNFSQIDVSFEYNENVQYYGSFNATEIDNFVVESVVTNGRVVKIAAGTAIDATVPYTSVNTVGEDAEGVVLTTVYFMVNSTAGVGEASFQLTDKKVSVVDEDNAFADLTMFANLQADAMTFTSAVLGDYYVDDAIDGIELLLIKQMINGNLDEVYDVTLDLNKDGEVSAADYELLKTIVNFDKAFDNLAYASVASMGWPIEEC